MNPLNAIKFVPLPVLQSSALFIAGIMNALPYTIIQKTITVNLLLAYPHLTAAEREIMKKKVIRNHILSSVESLKCWAMSSQWNLSQIHTVYNQNLFINALTDPKGMLAIVPHLGTWEMMNDWLNQFGSPTIMYKPIGNRLLNDFVLQGRQRLNATLVPTDAVGVKAIFKTLKQGGFSIILPDHVPKPSGGINVPFFEVETLTSTLAPKLASKTKCALVGLICVRHDTQSSNINNSPLEASDSFVLNQKGNFDIHCIPLTDPAFYNKDITLASTALNRALQDMINRYPSHYLWGYKRFKKTPIIKNPYKVSREQLQHFIDTYVKKSEDDLSSR